MGSEIADWANSGRLRIAGRGLCRGKGPISHGGEGSRDEPDWVSPIDTTVLRRKRICNEEKRQPFRRQNRQPSYRHARNHVHEVMPPTNGVATSIPTFSISRAGRSHQMTHKLQMLSSAVAA